MEIDVPRDRDGEYEPLVVRKHQREWRGFDNKILSMYALWLSTKAIQENLKDIYNVEVSPELISRVTDEVKGLVEEWRNRPLEPFYPVMFFDALRVNIRDEGHVSKKSVYLALSIRLDGLTGFPEAVNAVFPETEVQLCMVHMVRNSVKYVPYKDRKAVTADLKEIYLAPSADAAESALNRFAEKWGRKYPSISKSWRNRWSEVIPFMKFSPEIRKAIYTTNAIESLNYTLQRNLKTRQSFPNDEAAMKLIFMILRRISKKWTMPIKNWGEALHQFALIYGDRVPL